jgi:hypothetical protein
MVIKLNLLDNLECVVGQIKLKSTFEVNYLHFIEAEMQFCKEMALVNLTLLIV